FFLLRARGPRHLHPFPTRRSSDLSLLVESWRATRGRRDSSDVGSCGGMRCVDGMRAHGADVARHRGETEQRWRLCRVLLELSERSEEHTSELQSRENLVCRLLLEK